MESNTFEELFAKNKVLNNKRIFLKHSLALPEFAPGRTTNFSKIFFQYINILKDDNTILTELQIQKSEDDEDGHVYYTILQNGEDESFTLKTEEDEFLDSNNVFYLSLNNEDLEETETIETQDDNSTTEESNVNMEFLEQVTLPDGTQAYMTRDSPDGNDLFQRSEGTFELTDSSVLLQSLTEEVKCDEDENDLNTNSDDEKETNLEDNIILAQDADEDLDLSKYEQIQLEDGSVAMIEISLYNKILEQSKKKELTNKEKQKESAGSSSKPTFQCPNDNCNKSYTTMHHLRVHMRNHTGTRPYVCQVEGCDKAFATGYSLKAHSRTHTGEKPYACQTCIKRFKTSGDLQKHNRIHTGEKPFLCPIEGCGRSFTTSNIRKVHIRSHTGERPYQCPEPGCNKAFASATNYKNHVRIHSGEKPYSCSFEGCAKRFTEYSSLYKHQIVHSNSKPCRCEYCGRICRQPATLIAHKRSVHNIIVTDNGTEIMVKMVDDETTEEEVTGDVDDLSTQIWLVTQ